MVDSFIYDGRPVRCEPGQTVAAALWAAGVRSWRGTRLAGAPRGLFCGIGACYDCLATIDGASGQRTCLTPARPGLHVTSATGVVRPDGSAETPVPASDVPMPPSGVPVSGVPVPGAPAPGAPAPVDEAYDVAVIGAGPAGLAAAATAALGGCRVALLDAAPRPGGQFWRHRAGSTAAADGGSVQRDWSVFQGLCSIVEDWVDHLAGTTVWFVEPSFAKLASETSQGFVLHTRPADGSAPAAIRADRLVIATGAYDRTVPFPGWELPGVVTPGGAQALLKGSGVVVGRRVVVAGAGPFLLPVAVGLARAGATVTVVEAGAPGAYARQPGVLAGATAKLGEAAGYAAAMARHRIAYHTRHAVVAAYGRASVSHVDIAALDRQGGLGRVRPLACDAVAVGYGFTANLELALTLGCATRLGADGGLALAVDDDAATSVPGVWAAGEVTGVGGAALAVTEGILAGAAVTVAAGRAPAQSSRELARLRRRQARLRSFADLMHAAHPVPAGWPTWLRDETLICRCEEVPYAAVRHAIADLGAGDARTVKLLARPGMGWCQGRVCGYATAVLAAAGAGRPCTGADLEAMAQRPFAVPVRLSELAATP